VVAEQVGIKNKPLEHFWLSPAQRDVLLLVPGVSQAVKDRLATKGASFTMAEVAGMAMALAEDLPEGDPRKQVAALLVAKHLLERLADDVDDLTKAEEAKAKKPKAKSSATTVYQFKITLKNIKPPIWRRIQVKDCSLDKLHEHIPIKALSTNCLYYNAYVTVEKMALELKAPVDPQWKIKAENLRTAINSRLWSDEKGDYRFLVGPFGKCDLQEGLGSSYALLFGIADPKQAEGIILWKATSRQTWAATAYLRMVLLGLAGMRFDNEGVRFQPCIPKEISHVELRNIKYRSMNLDLTIRGTGTKVKQCLINGQEVKDGLLGAGGVGRNQVVITLSDR
jgi:hypothetical protein